MEKESLYELAKRVHEGDSLAFVKIIERKRNVILKYACQDEDCYQYIVEKLFATLKNRNFN